MKQKNSKSNKIVIIGDTNVGKTCIIERLINNTFGNTKSTIGASYTDIKIKGINLKIWDTAGQEKFRSMINMYYKGAKCIIICYDITEENSFNNVKNWLSEIEKNVNGIFIILVGNKCDLNDNRKITYENAEIFAKENNMFYIETSAKNNINVNKLFDIIADKIALINKDEDNCNIDISKNNNYNYNCGCFIL